MGQNSGNQDNAGKNLRQWEWTFEWGSERGGNRRDGINGCRQVMGSDGQVGDTLE